VVKPCGNCGRDNRGEEDQDNFAVLLGESGENAEQPIQTLVEKGQKKTVAKKGKGGDLGSGMKRNIFKQD